MNARKAATVRENSSNQGNGMSGLDRISGRLGRAVLRPLLYLLDLTAFIIHALHDWVRRGHLRNAATRRSLVVQILFTGIDALPLVLVLGLAIGLTLTPTMLLLAQSLGSDTELARFLILAIGVEMGPLLTAIILIGRSGSAIAVELGNMSQRGEVGALMLMGINLSDFFTAPRLLGSALSQLVLAVYFTGVALFGGILIIGLLISEEHLQLMPVLVQTIAPIDLLVFISKNLLFGLLIAAAACYQAQHIGQSPTEVPQRTQQAIVNAYLLIFAISGLFALIRLLA